jgi:zinc/manganese transport system permease protein
MELLGVQRARGRDLAIGIVLGLGNALAALFFWLEATQHNEAGAPATILFGSIFAIPSSLAPVIVALGLAALAIVLGLHRRLLLASTSPELAAARGIPVRTIGVLYLVALVLAVALAALTIGTILSTALLVGPAASAIRLTARPLRALAVAAVLGVLATWAGIVLAYDSYYWPPAGHGWPVSFFVVTLVFGFYLLSGLPRIWRERRARGGGWAPEARGALAGRR